MKTKPVNSSPNNARNFFSKYSILFLYNIIIDMTLTKNFHLSLFVREKGELCAFTTLLVTCLKNFFRPGIISNSVKKNDVCVDDTVYESECRICIVELHSKCTIKL